MRGPADIERIETHCALRRRADVSCSAARDLYAAGNFPQRGSWSRTPTDHVNNKGTQVTEPDSG